jgi:hypothetical protein
MTLRPGLLSVRPSRAQATRLAITAACGAYGALLTAAFQDPRYIRGGFDFYWSYRAAHDLLAGADVYGHSTASGMIPYPLPAALVGVLFAWLPAPAAGPLFFGLSSALLAYLITRDGPSWRLVLFASTPFFLAAKSVQWSPLLFCVPLLPSLLPLVLVKPTLGAAVAVCTRLNVWNVTAAAAVVVITLFISPDWVARWLPQTSSYTGYVPLLTAPGLVLVAAVWRWREPKARCLLALACVPQQLYLYDALLLWSIPHTRRAAFTLTGLSWVAMILPLLGLERPWWPALTVMCLYWPCLLIVMRRRPRSAVSPANLRSV